MTKEECRAFVIRAVAHAMSRDGSSGGCIRLVISELCGRAAQHMVEPDRRRVHKFVLTVLAVDESGARREFIPGEKVPLVGGEMTTPNSQPVLAQ